MSFYYRDDYGPHLVSMEPPRPSSWLRSRIGAALRGRLEFNTQLLPEMSPGRMLEIGCSHGGFLARMAEAGWSVTGIEIAERPAAEARARGFRVLTCSVNEAPAPSVPYDLIVGWMVLEHLHDPVEALRKMYEWTHDQGWLVLSVPNAASFEFRLFRDKWLDLDLPRHLYHFTPDTLRRVLAAAGWTTEAVHHQRLLTNLILSTGYLLEGARRTARIGEAFRYHDPRLNYLLYPLASLAAHFGQTGRMTIFARKSV